MTEALKLPLEKQPIPSLLAQYQALWHDTSLPVTDRRIIAVRIAQLRRSQEVVSAIQQINTVRQATTPTPQADASTSSAPSTPAPPQPRYVVTGVLLGSAVYNGVELPRLFRVVDPDQSRTVGYVRPGPAFNASTTLGKRVGVVGRKTVDPVTKFEVIDAQRVDVLATPG